MVAYTADELFARDYCAETGFCEPSIRMVLSSFDEKSRGFDMRAKFSRIPYAEHPAIISQYGKSLAELEKLYSHKTSRGRTLILGETKGDIESWLSEQREKKEKIYDKLSLIARDFIKSLDHRPDFGYIQGSASLESKKPFLYSEEGGNTFFFSDIDVVMIYSVLNRDIFEHCLEQSWRKSNKNKIKINVWPFTYDNINQKTKSTQMVYFAHTFDDINRGYFFSNDKKEKGIRLY